MAIDISKALPAQPAAASTARSPSDSDRARTPSPAAAKGDSIAMENLGSGDIDPVRLAEVVRRANASVEVLTTENRGLRFEVNEPTQRVVVKVMDEDKETVVRQFPPEEFLEVASRLREFRSVLVDDVA